MNRIEIKWSVNLGLGTFISALSLIYHANKPVRWLVQEKDSHIVLTGFIPTIKALCLDENLIEFQIVDNEQFIEQKIGDTAKLFSPYIKYKGTKNNTDRKPFILIAMYGNSNPLDFDPNSEEQPFVKFYPMDVYAKIIQICLAAGYDIITFDKSTFFGVAEKIDFMLMNCEAVIGYEGGLSHLAHVLDIPSIILPWKTYSNITLLHMDSKTYHIRDINEINKMTVTSFLLMLEKCRNNKSNNILFSDNYEIYVTPSYGHILLKDLNNQDYSYQWNTPWLLSAETEFIKNHLIPTKLGGIKEFTFSGNSYKIPIFPEVMDYTINLKHDMQSVGGPLSIVGTQPNVFDKLKLREFQDKMKNTVLNPVKFKKWKPKKPKL